MQNPNPNPNRRGRFTVTTKLRPESDTTQIQTRIQPGTVLKVDSDPQIVPKNTKSSTFPPPLSSSSSSSPSPAPPMAFFSPQNPTPQSQTMQIQAPQFQFQQQPAQVQQQSQLLLYTKENKAPAGWGTKWEDLHPDSQKVLLQIEERIREYRDESEKLDQCSRLYESSVSNEGFELDATHIIQELGTTSTAIEREKLSLQKLATNIKEIMRNTELAIHSYTLLRPRFTNSLSNQPTSQIAPAVHFDFYHGLPKRPSGFLVDSVERLWKFLEECIKWVEELEQLVQMEGSKERNGSIESLPKVMSNLHDYFIYVASKVENLHQYVEQMKTSYLTEQRRRGDYSSDPFLEADRRDAARRAAAAMRVHPTLHLPPATPTAAHQTPAPNPTPQLPQQQTPLIGSGLFSTPQQQPAPSSGLFGGGTPQLQSTPFGSGSGSLFGSTPVPSGGFGSGSLFGSTPAPSAGGFGSGATGFGIGSASQTAIAGSNLFSTPAFGGASVSGASFGGTSKAARPKTRTGRR